MTQFLVPPNNAWATAAAKRIEFNYLKHQIKKMVNSGVLPKIKDILGDRDIDPRDLSIDQLFEIRDRVRIYGFTRGKINTEKGFGTGWLPKTPKRRITDNRIILPIPEAGRKRDGLLTGLPSTVNDYVEDDNPSWYLQSDIIDNQ